MTIERVPSSASSATPFRRREPAAAAASTMIGVSAGATAAWSGVLESWFEALDQTPFAVGVERAIAQVAGIHVDGADLWMQIEFAEGVVPSLILRVTPGMSVRDALEAVQRMLR